MRKIFLCALVLSAVLIAGTAAAAQIGRGDNYNLPKSQVIDDNLYAFGGTVSIMGNAKGDLAAFGGTLLVSGDAGKDAAFGGGNMILQGNIGDDLRAAGGTIMVFGRIGGEALLAGGQITLAEGSFISKDLLIAGGAITLSGEINGGVEIRGGNVVINGKINGPVRIYADKVIIAEGAVLQNGLVYNSPVLAEISQNAQINGSVVFNETKAKAAGAKFGQKAFWPIFTTFWLLKIAMSLALGFVLFALFKKQATSLSAIGLKNYWWNLLRGFVLAILLPITAIILFITVIGVPLGAIIVFASILALILASALSGIMLGSLVFKLVKKTAEYTTDWWSVGLGIILLHFLSVFPFVGWIICALFFLAAFGTIFNFGYQKFKTRD